MSDSRPDFPIVGIAAPAGEPGVLRALLAGFSAGSGMALVVVPDALPDPCLASRLRLVTGCETIEPGQAYLVPPGRGVRVQDGRLVLQALDTPQEQPVDALFDSLAGLGQQAAAVILGDTGGDGSRGLRAIKENGGLVVAQAGTGCTPLMAGLADLVLPAPGILPELVRCLHWQAETPSAEQLAAVCHELHEVTGHDVSGHTPRRLTRCIQRRILVLGLGGARDYVERARDDPAECDALLHDLLVNTTRFFRDPGAFAALREAVEPLIRDCPEGEAIRLWVPGCSSGEEAYSLALLLREAMQRLDRFPAISLTATDIDPRMLALARAARYPLSALAEIPEALRARFTVAAADHFTFAAEIRDMVRFCRHSLIADPPFARLDLVSCRNLLGGFQPWLQRSTLARLHAALRPGGLLFLGSGETPDGIDPLFAGLDHEQRLFRCRPEPLQAGPPAPGPEIPAAAQPDAERERLRLALDVARIGIWEYDPATGATDLDQTERGFFDLSESGPQDSATLLARVHPEDRERVTMALRAVSALAPDFDQTFRVTGADGGERWLRGLGRFTRRSGAPRILGVSFDVTPERQMLEEHALHLSEVNHRIKNLFAVVSAMISNVERESVDTQDFSRNLRGRISALDRAHALMRREDLRAPIPLDQLIGRVLEPSRGAQRIVVEGPETLVPLRELTPLVLILHEWTTNSVKYGALSGHDGALTIRWFDSGDGLGLEWTETASEATDPANSSGFGSRLVQASIQQLRAELDRGVRDGRLHYRLTMPAFVTPTACDD